MTEAEASILTIGNELLRGNALNSNARFLGRELTSLGFQVISQSSCLDEMDEIQRALSQALSKADFIVLTGGLGPTPDDLTRDAVAQFFRVPLIFSKSQFSLISRYYRSRGRPIPDIVRREAMFPNNAKPLLNRYGVALGFSILLPGKLIIVLPGVPYELEGMFRHNVRGLIKAHFPSLRALPSFMARTVGLSEPEIMRRLGKDFFDRDFTFGIYPEPGEVTIRLQARSPQIIKKLKQKVRKRLAGSVYAEDEISLSQAVGNILKRRSKTLSVAESCTGGLLASEITKSPGASFYFIGSITTYSNRIKSDLVDVPKALLAKKGAASKEVALALASGIRSKMKTSLGIAVTGIAGPSGGSALKPVGLVHIAISTPRITQAWKFKFLGERIQIQIKAAKKALELLWRLLNLHESEDPNQKPAA